MKALLAPLLWVLAAPAMAQSLAVVNAEAWTLEDAGPVANATILMQDGRIVSVKAGGEVPAGAKVIDAGGRPVTPGFVNAATQIGLVDFDLPDDRSADERDPNYDPSRAFNGRSTLVTLARADGLTRALIYPAPSRTGPVSGEPAWMRLRNDVDVLDRARVAAYAVIGGGAWSRLGARAQQWTVLRRLLEEARRAGPPGAGAATVDPLRDVMAGNRPLAIETHRESDIRQALMLASDFDIRLVLVGASDAWRWADALASADIAVVLDPQANLPENVDQVGVRQDNAALLAKAGVRIAFGQTGGRRIPATYNAGMSLREGAGIAVANGLPYAEALRAATAGAMEVWGLEGGTLVAGAEADLVVWDADPLEPSSLAQVVVIEGREVPVRSRQDVLAERYANSNR